MKDKLISAADLHRTYMAKGKDKLRLATVINELELAPAVDAAPVVRCADCRLTDTIETKCGAKFFYCEWSGETVTAEDFCSHGTRRKA